MIGLPTRTRAGHIIIGITGFGAVDPPSILLDSTVPVNLHEFLSKETQRLAYVFQEFFASELKSVLDFATIYNSSLKI